MNHERLTATPLSKTIQLLLVLACLALPASIWANQASVLPKTNTFEGLTINSSIVGSDGWYADTNLYAIVTNIDISAWSSTNSCGFPVSTATHTNVIKLDTENSAVSNLFGATHLNNNVVIDKMIQMVASPDEDAQGVITNDAKIQMAYYLNTNGQLVIYHSYMANWEQWALDNTFTVVSNLPTVSSGDWARITVTMDYKSDTYQSYRFYQIALNGVTASNILAFTNRFEIGTEDTFSGYDDATGTWFIVSNNDSGANTFLSAVSFSGTGYFDDFIAFGDDTTPTYSITASYNDYRGGYIQPSGVILLLQGESTNFTIVKSNYWDMALLSNSISIPEVSSVAFDNVTQNHTLEATFTPDRGTNNVPHWWVAQQHPDWTNSALFDTYILTDLDGDGLTAWQEWLAGTRENDAGSRLELDFAPLDGTNLVLSWTVLSGYDTDLNSLPYLIRRSTNLVEGTWEDVHSQARSIGTHSWTDPNPPADAAQAFYRLAVTNSY